MTLLPIPVHKIYHLQFLTFKELLKKILIGVCYVILISNTPREIRFANASIASSPREILLVITL